MTKRGKYYILRFKKKWGGGDKKTLEMKICKGKLDNTYMLGWP